VGRMFNTFTSDDSQCGPCKQSDTPRELSALLRGGRGDAHGGGARDARGDAPALVRRGDGCGGGCRHPRVDAPGRGRHVAGGSQVGLSVPGVRLVTILAVINWCFDCEIT
jgi:hypothetical protein